MRLITVQDFGDGEWRVLYLDDGELEAWEYWLRYPSKDAALAAIAEDDPEALLVEVQAFFHEEFGRAEAIGNLDVIRKEEERRLRSSFIGLSIAK